LKQEYFGDILTKRDKKILSGSSLKYGKNVYKFAGTFSIDFG